MLVIVFFANSFISYDRPMHKFNSILSLGSFTSHVTFANFKNIKMKMMIPVINIFCIASISKKSLWNLMNYGYS